MTRSLIQRSMRFVDIVDTRRRKTQIGSSMWHRQAHAPKDGIKIIGVIPNSFSMPGAIPKRLVNSTDGPCGR